MGEIVSDRVMFVNEECCGGETSSFMGVKSESAQEERLSLGQNQSAMSIMLEECKTHDASLQKGKSKWTTSG